MAKNYRPVSFLSDKSLKTLFKISLLITLRNAVFFIWSKVSGLLVQNVYSGIQFNNKQNK